jgi:hypothetical protein
MKKVWLSAHVQADLSMVSSQNNVCGSPTKQTPKNTGRIGEDGNDYTGIPTKRWSARKEETPSKAAPTATARTRRLDSRREQYPLGPASASRWDQPGNTSGTSGIARDVRLGKS